MSLATLATVNFSLAFIIGLLSSPFTFVQASKNAAVRWTLAGLLTAVAPTSVAYAAAQVWGLPIAEILKEASFGWDVWGLYTPVVVWCVWWPAWLIAMVNVLGTEKI